MKLEIQNGCFTYPKAKNPILTDVSFSLSQVMVKSLANEKALFACHMVEGKSVFYKPCFCVSTTAS